MIENEHRISARIWKRWGPRSQKIFNDTYEFMRGNQWSCKHPKTAPLSDEEWDTLAFNAAWLAADTASKIKDT